MIADTLSDMRAQLLEDIDRYSEIGELSRLPVGLHRRISTLAASIDVLRADIDYYQIKGEERP
jgi:septum formation topological specificity factor MinE